MKKSDQPIVFGIGKFVFLMTFALGLPAAGLSAAHAEVRSMERNTSYTNPSGNYRIAFSTSGYSTWDDIKITQGTTVLKESFDGGIWNPINFEVALNSGSASNGYYESNGTSLRAMLRTRANFQPSLSSPVRVEAKLRYKSTDADIAFLSVRSTGVSGSFFSEPADGVYFRLHNFSDGQAGFKVTSPYDEYNEFWGDQFYNGKPLRVVVTDDGSKVALKIVQGQATSTVINTAPTSVLPNLLYTVAGKIMVSGGSALNSIPGSVTVTGDGQGCTDNYLEATPGTPGSYDFACQISSSGSGNKTIVATYKGSGDLIDEGFASEYWIDASTSAARTVKTDYILSGYAQPVDNWPTVNTMKAGAAFPAKWQVRDSNGGYISSLSSFSGINWISTSCSDATNSSAEIETITATGNTGLRYDSSANQFVYNVSTSSAWSNQCRILAVTLDSGQTMKAFFKFR